MSAASRLVGIFFAVALAVIYLFVLTRGHLL